jgi:hypothetical protein
MSNAESEAWLDAVSDLVGEEAVEADLKLQDMIKPQSGGMPRSAGMHVKTPQDLLPRPSM